MPDWHHSLEPDSNQDERAEFKAKFGEVPDDPDAALAWLEALAKEELDES